MDPFDDWGMRDDIQLDGGPIEVVSLLVFIQGAVALTLSIEAIGGAIIFGGVPIPGALLSLGGTFLTFYLGRRVRRRSRRARRWLKILQFGWLTMAMVDTGLALFLAGVGPGPAALFTRFFLPISILWILRKTKSEFLATEEPAEPVQLQLAGVAV